MLEAFGGRDDIGADAQAKGIGEESPVHRASIYWRRCSGEGQFECLFNIARHIECVPGEVIARSACDDTQRRLLPRFEDAVDDLMDGAITANHDYRTFQTGSVVGKHMGIT